MADYIKENGTIIPDTSELLETVQGEYRQALGANLNLNPSTPQGRLIEAEVEARRRMLVNNATLANTINPEQSFGVFLDSLCALTGITRIVGTASRVFATLQGVPGTSIPANSRAQSTLGDMWRLENDVILPAGGTVEAYFVAETVGPVSCPTGSLNKIVDAVLGWETVTNSAPASLGTETESDASLRQRRRQQLYRGEALLASIRSAVRQVSGVVSEFGAENETNVIKTIEGIILQPHSIYIVADGGSDEDVARAIFEHKSLGCGYTGTVEVTVEDEGVPYTVAFNRPDYQPIQVSVTVTAPAMTEDITQSVKDALSAWANGEITGVSGLNLGVDVSPFEAASAITSYLPNLFVNNVQVGLVSGSLGTTVLEMKINQKATLSQDNITVTVQ